MSDFGLHWYFFLERKTSPAEKAFKSVIDRLKLYEQHTTSTTTLYRREFTEAKKQIDIDEKAAVVAAKQRYNDILGGSERHEDHDWAMHVSGLDELDHHYYTVRESQAERFVEMADFFNKSSLVSLYGLLETDLRRLCFMLQTVFNKKIGVDMLSDRNYLQAFLEYFEFVIELPITQLEPHIVKLKELQQLRNRIVHDGALFSKKQKDKRLEDMVAAANGLLTMTQGV